MIHVYRSVGKENSQTLRRNALNAMTTASNVIKSGKIALNAVPVYISMKINALKNASLTHSLIKVEPATNAIPIAMLVQKLLNNA